LQRLQTMLPFSDSSKFQDLLLRLNGILATDTAGPRPRIPLTTLQDPSVLKQFVGVLDWAVQEIRTA